MTKHIDLPLSEVKCSYINTFLTGDHILDVGAGKGHYCHWLSSRNKELRLYAIDLQQRPGLPKEVTFFTYNLEQPIPLADETFHTVFAFDIIEHITNEQTFLHELFRLCKKGGVLIGSVPHDKDLFLPAYNLTFYHRSDLTHKRYYTAESLREALSSVGFINIKINEEGGVSPQVFAEFFPKQLHWGVKKFIGLLRRSGIINAKKLSSDLFFTATKTTVT